MTTARKASPPKVPRLSVVVPTLGLSRWLLPCLEALRRDGGDNIEIILVSQGLGSQGLTLDPNAASIADRVLRLDSNQGFAAANNAGWAIAGSDYLATVNDDAIVTAGWCDHLLAALDDHPQAAAAQGINLVMENPTEVDGGGVAWNRAWQAVQIGRGQLRSALPSETGEIFGISATAGVYRRTALEQVGGLDLQAFDARLFAYYEDVDLACRLRAAGFVALQVPRAEARHAGSVSGSQLPGGNAKWIYGNRQLVLAQLLGRSFWPRWPRILLRDAADLWHARRRGDVSTARGIFAGSVRFLRHCPSFARLGPPMVPLRQLHHFRNPDGSTSDGSTTPGSTTPGSTSDGSTTSGSTPDHASHR